MSINEPEGEHGPEVVVEVDSPGQASWDGTVDSAYNCEGEGRVVVEILDGDRAGQTAEANVVAGNPTQLRGLTPFQ